MLELCENWSPSKRLLEQKERERERKQEKWGGLKEKFGRVLHNQRAHHFHV